MARDRGMRDSRGDAASRLLLAMTISHGTLASTHKPYFGLAMIEIQLHIKSAKDFEEEGGCVQVLSLSSRRYRMDMETNQAKKQPSKQPSEKQRAPRGLRRLPSRRGPE